MWECQPMGVIAEVFPGATAANAERLTPKLGVDNALGLEAVAIGVAIESTLRMGVIAEVFPGATAANAERLTPK